MSDFPTVFAGPCVTIHPWSQEALGGLVVANGSTTFFGTSSAAWPAANRALFIPFVLRTPIVVAKLMWFNGATVAGNVDVGIYDRTGTRIASVRNDKGSDLAQAGVNAIQSYDIADFGIGPGTFYLAMASDSATATFLRGQNGSAAEMGKFLGMYQQASAYPLPATATFATAASTYIPKAALTTRTLI